MILLFKLDRQSLPFASGVHNLAVLMKLRTSFGGLSLEVERNRQT